MEAEWEGAASEKAEDDATAMEKPAFLHRAILDVLPTSLLKYLDFLTVVRLARTCTDVKSAVGDLRRWASVLPVVLPFDRSKELLRILNEEEMRLRIRFRPTKSDQPARSPPNATSELSSSYPPSTTSSNSFTSFLNQPHPTSNVLLRLLHLAFVQTSRGAFDATDTNPIIQRILTHPCVRSSLVSFSIVNLGIKRTTLTWLNASGGRSVPWGQQLRRIRTLRHLVLVAPVELVSGTREATIVELKRKYVGRPYFLLEEMDNWGRLEGVKVTVTPLHHSEADAWWLEDDSSVLSKVTDSPLRRPSGALEVAAAALVAGPLEVDDTSSSSTLYQYSASPSASTESELTKEDRRRMFWRSIIRNMDTHNLEGEADREFLRRRTDDGFKHWVGSGNSGREDRALQSALVAESLTNVFDERSGATAR
ncbi:hypothetical protein M427DRAFT_144788 [Gonapodya prolifera JEL478]|uniref:F-box domain-containing protein n=1 Tax=Gonapodya prolifera (strain JEL478) TaxID=1344416 RepID=A0A139AI31_GONPJ|nr:hypothetical protein M427DRAFT_144788 [Gonapodya prolifera JEL478]|eukprot:KXS16476.1 hypothetical protein M427DRAFT_144788 [Gonapodya prolifera JEL478]